jgi:peptide subunit release factor 1 (eRF1)
VRHTKRGGGSQAPGRRGGTAGQTRYSEEIAERNLKEAAQIAGQFFKNHGVRRVILGGSEATISFFEKALPKAWQSLIIGSFAMDMNAGSNLVVEKALAVAREAELEREEALINRLITTAAKGGEAVLTLDETLEAVHAGRIQHLVLVEGFRQAGYQCQSCDYLTVQPMDKCPFCGGTFREIEDAVEFAVRRVLEDGGEVEVINHAAGLDEAGKIGALLRY